MSKIGRKTMEFRLTEERILHLLKGKTLRFVREGMPVVVMHPPQGHITLTREEFERLMREVNTNKEWIRRMLGRVLGEEGRDQIIY